MESQNKDSRIFSLIKILIAIIACFAFVLGLLNNRLNLNILFLFGSFSFLTSVIENYFLDRKSWNFISDLISAILFMLMFILI